MISQNDFSRTRKYDGKEVGDSIGRYFYGYYKEWQIEEKYDESTEQLYHTIEGIDERFDELSEAEEVLYNLFLAENKLTEDYI